MKRKNKFKEEYVLFVIGLFVFICVVTYSYYQVNYETFRWRLKQIFYQQTPSNLSKSNVQTILPEPPKNYEIKSGYYINHDLGVRFLVPEEKGEEEIDYGSRLPFVISWSFFSDEDTRVFPNVEYRFYVYRISDNGMSKYYYSNIEEEYSHAQKMLVNEQFKFEKFVNGEAFSQKTLKRFPNTINGNLVFYSYEYSYGGSDAYPVYEFVSKKNDDYFVIYVLRTDSKSVDLQELYRIANSFEFLK